MLEPMPGTQVIVEYISDCSSSVSKVYPPNSSVLIHNLCDIDIEVLGEVRKLVVIENEGNIDLRKFGTIDEVFTEQFVIKSNNWGIYIQYKT